MFYNIGIGINIIKIFTLFYTDAFNKKPKTCPWQASLALSKGYNEGRSLPLKMVYSRK
jgi:hypothetical protein